MESDLHTLILGMWIALGVLWAVLWLARLSGGRPAARSESTGSRLLHLALMTMAFWLLFRKAPELGPLSSRIFPDTPAVQITGAIITFAGLAFTAWARTVLGRNWSAVVTIRQDHHLIRTGPYRWVRHPIYSGLLLAMLGTAISLGLLRGLAGTLIGLAAFRMKASLEEAFLTEQFGPEYIEYKKKVKALIPSVL
jgi:protein-S-isoprenylcysteine O-methyltransferase Ste14